MTAGRLAALTLVAGLVIGRFWVDRWLASARHVPDVAPLDVYEALFDQTAMNITITIGTDRVPAKTTVDALLTDRALWRRMHLADWNAVPPPTITRGLNAMFDAYRPLLFEPSVWDGMTPEDWDDVPQPIRTVAYRQMVAYWAGFYHVGVSHGLAPGQASNALAAIVMSESWFDHRAIAVYADGRRDIGLGGASDYARARLRALKAEGTVDVALSEEEYFNPWKATRFVAIWMSLLLDEAAGDLDFAIRAYNRGVTQAYDRFGDEYLAIVKRRLAMFIRNRDAPPAWSYIWIRAREIERVTWPWAFFQAP